MDLDMFGIMEDVHEFMLEEGFSKNEADFLSRLVNPKFVNRFLFIASFLKDDKEEEDFLTWFKNYYFQKKSSHIIYEGEKTTYLIEKEIYDEIIEEIGLLDSKENDYRPVQTPILVEREKGIIKIF